MNNIFGYINLNKKEILNSQITSSDGLISTKGSNYYIQKQNKGRFINDEMFFQNDSYFLCLNGVVLNSQFFLKKHVCNTLEDSLIKEYEKEGSTFCKQIKGSYSGILYDKRNHKWVIYTSHFADKQIYYFYNTEIIIFASKIADITKHLKEQNIPYGMDELGIGSMMTYGYMLKDFTLIKEIKKLSFGCFIEIDHGKVKKGRYWDFDNTKYLKVKENDIIAKVDYLFREAVKLEYNKDREYNYPHFTTLSAGLDSRMNVWVANDLGYKPHTNYTFCRHQYPDQTVAQQIAYDLKNSFVFHLLHEENFFDGYQDEIYMKSGASSLSGTVKERNINFSGKGIIHTGQLGDVILGTYNKTPEQIAAKAYNGAFSKTKIPSISSVDYGEFPNNEYFLLTQRGFNGILQGNLPFQKYSEVCSPFMDLDFFEYCMQIPLKYRYNHRIYIKWIKTYYPKAARYLWDKTMAPVSDLSIRYKNTILPISNLVHIQKALLPRIGKVSKRFKSFSREHSMTPRQFWFEQNTNLQDQINKTIRDSKTYEQFNGDLLKTSKNILQKNDFTSKVQLLSIVETLDFLF